MKFDGENRVPMWFDRGTILVPGNPVYEEASGITVTVLGKSNRRIPKGIADRYDKGDYFKVDFADDSYFVKVCSITNNPGYFQFQYTQGAKEILKDSDYVKVIEAKLGYQDDIQSWFVSDWEDDPREDDVRTTPTLKYKNQTK